MAAHSSILFWEIPWTEEPGMGLHRVAKEWGIAEQLSTQYHVRQ